MTPNKKRRRRPRRPVVQVHHISYDPEETVVLWKGEHWLATQMNRRRRVSKGFLTYLGVFKALWENKAEELKKPT